MDNVHFLDFYKHIEYRAIIALVLNILTGYPLCITKNRMSFVHHSTLIITKVGLLIDLFIITIKQIQCF